MFVSYNNHPINGVYDKLSKLTYHGKRILFPILRLGNQQKTKEALQIIKNMYEEAQFIIVFGSRLDRNKDERKKRARHLSNLLRKYEELLDLKEREETIERLLDYGEKHNQALQMLPFEADLSGRQKAQIEKKIHTTGTVSEEEVFSFQKHTFV